MIPDDVQRFLEKLGEQQGQFLLDGGGGIRHETLVDADGCPACPRVAVQPDPEAVSNNDVPTSPDLPVCPLSCESNVLAVAAADNLPYLHGDVARVRAVRQAMFAAVGLAAG